MNILVTGATGFIGAPLVAKLLERGDTVTALVRDPDRARAKLGAAKLVRAELEAPGAWCDELDGADAVIHLAGEPIAGKRWDARQKQLLRDSRVETARNVVEAIGKASKRPRVLVGASGVDIDPHALGVVDFDDDPVTEADPPGDDFLARLCVRWEAEIAAAERFGVRTASMRTGLVLAAGGGALARMATPFALFVGGRIGNGRQLVSWIHRDDAIAAYIAALDDDRFVGPINLVAGSVRNAELARAIGRALHRPSWVPVPAFALRLAVGELAESILHGRNVVPDKLRRLGFSFAHPDLTDAIACSLGHART
jgi:uncharacterized protein (TIGR01777 family)